MTPLNILVVGAHPDDAELNAGGCAITWARRGHRVKFLALTNGDVGHAHLSGTRLADLRRQEVEEAARILGVTTEVLDIHDGELMPTLANRLALLQRIRTWNADVVIGHRPYDYHPDHRAAGILMQDAAFMVTVRQYLPEVPCLDRNPVFLYSCDEFTTPVPFRADLVVPIDAVLETKMDALWCLRTQIESFWGTGNFREIRPIPDDPAGRAARRAEFAGLIQPRWRNQARQYRHALAELHGDACAANCLVAESFEICEYGRSLNSDERVHLLGLG